MLAGLVQFGLIFETQIGINNAIREGARRVAAIAAPNQAAAQANATWALGELQTALGNAQSYSASQSDVEVCIVNPSVNPNDASGSVQVVVRIKVVYRHPVFLPIVDLILDRIDGVGDRALSASNSTEFHVEQPGSNSVGIGGVARSNGVSSPCTP